MGQYIVVHVITKNLTKAGILKLRFTQWRQEVDIPSENKKKQNPMV